MKDCPRQRSFKYDLIHVMMAKQDWIESDTLKMKVRYVNIFNDFVDKWCPTVNDIEGES